MQISEVQRRFWIKIQTRPRRFCATVSDFESLVATGKRYFNIPPEEPVRLMQPYKAIIHKHEWNDLREGQIIIILRKGEKINNTIDHVLPALKNLPKPPALDLIHKHLFVKLQKCVTRATIRACSFEHLATRAKEAMEIPKEDPVRFIKANREIVDHQTFHLLNHFDVVVLIRDGEAINDNERHEWLEHDYKAAKVPYSIFVEPVNEEAGCCYGEWIRNICVAIGLCAPGPQKGEIIHA